MAPAVKIEDSLIRSGYDEGQTPNREAGKGRHNQEKRHLGD
jgi:hypothetical protein